MKEFLVAAEAVDEDERPPVEFNLRDKDTEDEEGNKVAGQERTLTAYFPGEGQLAAFMATNASFTSTPERVAGIVNFFVSVLEEEDHSYIVSRLFDRHDPFGTRHMMDILQYLVEQWTGKATGSPSGSTPRQRPAGQKSRRAIPAST